MVSQVFFLVLQALCTPSSATLSSNSQGSTQTLTGICSQFTSRSGGCNVDIDVPSACVVSARADCPLVFVFRLDDVNFADWVTNLSPIAHGSTFPFIGVYPRGGTDGAVNNGVQSYGWNTDGSTAVDDLSFVRAVALHIAGLGHTGRKYAVGFSNGAAMAQKAAVNYAALGLSGIVPGSTQLTSSPATSGPSPYHYNYPTTGTGTRKVAMLALHGSADGTISIHGGGVLGGLYNLSTTKDSAALWAKVNGCGAATVSAGITATYRSESGTVTTTAASAEYSCNPAYATKYVEVQCDNHRIWDASINGQSGYQYAFDWLAGVESACAADPTLCTSPAEYTGSTSFPPYTLPSCNDVQIRQPGGGNAGGGQQGGGNAGGGQQGRGNAGAGNAGGGQQGGGVQQCSAERTTMCCGDGVCGGPEDSTTCSSDCNSRRLAEDRVSGRGPFQEVSRGRLLQQCSCTADVTSTFFTFASTSGSAATASSASGATLQSTMFLLMLALVRT